MRSRDLLTSSVCAILAAALLFAAFLQLDNINAKRKEMKLVINEPLENAPPSLAFATVAMGAFRGLVVDVLWMRAEKLKEEGQFFDARQLAEWITVLQPRFASVWSFHAWNMAYNISVVMPATQPEERWRWVKNGYELLRDQGIVKNPKSILLYRELAWIFQHKMGGVTDDVHKYYKLQLALAMQPLIGDKDNKYFKALADAPAEWSQLITDANIVKIIDALTAVDIAFTEDAKFVDSYLSLRQNPSRFADQVFDVIDDFRGTTHLEKLDTFAKAYKLRNTWKLDPNLMYELNVAYGPVDFRDPNTNLPLNWQHPNVHAIYWAALGLKVASSEDYSADEVNTDRIVFHSLQSLFRNGQIYIYDATSPTNPDQKVKTVFLHPDLMMFEVCDKAWLDAVEKYTKLDGNVISIQNGHRNFLKNAILSFYQAGHKAQAQKIYNQLKQLYPKKEFNVPLVVFARNRLKEELSSIGITDAREIVVTMLWDGYYRYAVGDDDEAAGREAMAREVYESYMKEFSDEDVLRVDLPEMPQLRYIALNSFLSDQRYPPNLRQTLLARIELERPKLFEQLKAQHEKLLKKAAGDEQ